ncbi:molecular chaperone [Modicisalibacter tunisiensis]|uniref:chaperone modulator CbpM n=1 Tax=Modicisalibacter tunisiensis TaxID=390637 RepID=UPI000799B7D1|nr:chaperone modulator CbpM [Modicisalibacter tunisiensis]KXS39029.1 MAG: MerR family transcriptional regulator [Halomonadaceae bacterium T82-2]MBZ9538413.1 molecular chaperone [Modicisalibacter tunisiensis]
MVDRSQPLSGVILEEQETLTLADLSRACAVHAEAIIELVDEGILTPGGSLPQQWHFSGRHLIRARVALRLQRELGVNLAGAALALELMDEIERLRGG